MHVQDITIHLSIVFPSYATQIYQAFFDFMIHIIPKIDWGPMLVDP